MLFFCYEFVPVIRININTIQYNKENVINKFNQILNKRIEAGLDSNDVLSDINEKVKELFGNDFYISFDISDGQRKPNIHGSKLLREVRGIKQKEVSQEVTTVKNYHMITVPNIYKRDQLIVITNNKEAYCYDESENKLKIYATINTREGPRYESEDVLNKINELYTYIVARMMQEEQILSTIFGQNTRVFY